MSNPVDREGTFRATISAYGIQNAESGALGIALTFDLTELWQAPADGAEGQWFPWSDYGQQAQGTFWIIKKDGKPNTNAIEQLCKYAGWDGKLAPIAEEKWEPTPLQVVVKLETQKREGKPDRTEFRASFINDFHRVPGAMGNVDAAKAAELDARFGGSLKAIASTVAASKSPPAAGKAPAPSRPAPPAPPMVGVPSSQTKQAMAAAAANGDETPF